MKVSEGNEYQMEKEQIFVVFVLISKRKQKGNDNG